MRDDVHTWDDLSTDEKRLYGSERLQQLRERPILSSELEKNLDTFSMNQRQFVERLKLTGVQGDTARTGGKVNVVYYLAGDERRAIRRFIEANEEIVAKALTGQNNIFASEWSDFLYSLLQSEWRFCLCGRE